MDIVSEAKSWVGTPYKVGYSVKGEGCDCIGIAIGIANYLHLDIVRENFVTYVLDNTLINELDKLFKRKFISDRKSGDLLVFRLRNAPTHVGIYVLENNTEYLIHADIKYGVVMHPLGYWKSRIVAVYSLDSSGKNF